MENIIAVTRTSITDAELRNWLGRKNGYWVDDDLQQGVVERAEGAVYISLYGGYFCELEQSELFQLERQLGGPPATAVSFTISRSPTSELLANELVEAFCADWEGVRASH